MAHRDALDAYLNKVSPGIGFRIEPVVLEIPGWALFTGAQLDVRDDLPFFWVVRDDGRVVVENREAELASMYRSFALLTNPDAHPPETLGMMATWLLGKGAKVLKGAQHARFAPMYDDGLLTLPTKVLNGDIYRLTFWSVVFERGPIFQKWQITVAKDYAVKVDIETPDLIRK